MQNIRNLGAQFSAAVAYRLGYAEADPSQALLRRFADYFLAGVIRERARHLARGDDSKIEQFRSEVEAQYLERLREAALSEIADARAVIRKQNPDWLGVAGGALDMLESNLDSLYAPSPLSDADFASRSAFARLVRRCYGLIAESSGIARLVTPEAGEGGKPAGYARRILRPENADVIAGVLLRSAQRVVLNIIQDDYVIPGKWTEVPDDTEKTVRGLLAKFDDIGGRVKPYPALAPRKLAEAGMRAATARAEGRVWLPLRPVPTAPLADAELERHYVGRPDSDAVRLARQIRHADGAILVSGYRGVGKSSFVNRVLLHAQRAQAQPPEDGWLVVPITISLAKVAGVENVLRTTLRSVRNALLSPDATPRPVPGLADARPLPLRSEEITLLEEAYLRATWKVTLSRANTMERKWEIGSSVSFDPGKALSPLAGWDLGKFLTAGVSKSRAEKVYREVSLLNYDENAAEDDLSTLIHDLASPRPLRADGPPVRVKLVFVFDELDKMDVDKGLKPMIEGLKNLFLQQHAVFILVTSKKFYYDLLKDRAIEDAMLNSYFSAIVHVPLLTFAQARRMLEDWIDWEGVDPLKDPNNPESKLLDQLGRYLTYRSFGNPREIIRELRQMQDWAEARDQPYLTDRLASLPGLRVYAAMQEAIELVAAPRAETSAGVDGGGGVALVSERLSGDEARLEQVRRGLYILAEEIINNQTLSLEAAALTKIQENNFSLLSVADVQQLANRLGSQLASLHLTLPPELFAPLAPAQLFRFETQPTGVVLATASEFYALTGRLAAASAAPAAPTTTAPAEQLVAEAETLAAREGWAERLSALGIVSQLGPARLTPPLRQLLADVINRDIDVSHRLTAAERLTPEMVFSDPVFDLPGVLLKERDERLISIYLRLLSAASDEASRKLATDAMLKLLEEDSAQRAKQSTDGFIQLIAAAELPRLTSTNAIDALTALQTVAYRDVTREVLAWLRRTAPGDDVQSVAFRALHANASQYNADLGERIIADADLRRLFAEPPPTALSKRLSIQSREQFIRELLGARPLDYAAKLLDIQPNPDGRPDNDVNRLLSYIWQIVLDMKDRALLQEEAGTLLSSVNAPHAMDRLVDSFRLVPEYRQRASTLRTQVERAAKAQDKEPRYSPEVIALASQFLDRVLQAEQRQLQTEGEAVEKTALAEEAVKPNLAAARASRRSWPRAAAFIASLSLFGSTLYVFRGDLPPDSGIVTALFSRLLIAAFDVGVLLSVGVLIYLVVEIASLARPSVRPPEQKSAAPGAAPPANWSTLLGGGVAQGVLAALVGGTMALHTNFIGPVTFWNQVALFFINVLTLGLAAIGFGIDRETTRAVKG